MDKKDIQKHAIEKRKSRDKTRRKRQILEAAGKVFLQKGYINATMDDISLEVGLTKPTIYKYFKNIDHMCYLLIVPLIDSITQNLERLEKDVLAGKYQSGAQLIHDIFQTFYEGYKISPDIFRLLQFFQQSGAIWNLEEESGNLLMRREGITPGSPAGPIESPWTKGFSRNTRPS